VFPGGSAIHMSFMSSEKSDLIGLLPKRMF